jgi:hypothetical protein
MTFTFIVFARVYRAPEAEALHPTEASGRCGAIQNRGKTSSRKRDEQ